MTLEGFSFDLHRRHEFLAICWMKLITKIEMSITDGNRVLKCVTSYWRIGNSCVRLQTVNCWICRHLKIEDILKKLLIDCSPLLLRWGPRLTLYFMGEGYGLILGRFGV